MQTSSETTPKQLYHPTTSAKLTFKLWYGMVPGIQETLLKVGWTNAR